MQWELLSPFLDVVKAGIVLTKVAVELRQIRLHAIKARAQTRLNSIQAIVHAMQSGLVQQNAHKNQGDRTGKAPDFAAHMMSIPPLRRCLVSC